VTDHVTRRPRLFPAMPMFSVVVVRNLRDLVEWIRVGAETGAEAEGDSVAACVADGAGLTHACC
jgi:hypothetical protein